GQRDGRVVIEHAAARYGLEIVIDPRCNEALRKSLPIRADSTMTIRSILELIAETHDLKILLRDHDIFVTTQEQHLKRLRERIEELRLRRELGLLGSTPGEEVLPNPAPDGHKR